jgi:3-oxoacyl-[acyl-carrier-protein] synthase-3
MSKITAFATYTPDNVVSNDFFESRVETNDEWIISRTGIKTRVFSAENEFSSDLGVAAVKKMVKAYDLDIQDIDFIIVCTTTPDQIMPNTASRIQSKLGIKGTGCIDLYAACAGFVYGLQIAHGFANTGVYKKILVIGAETLTKSTDFTDRTSCILFGDAAGAAIVEPSDKEFLLAFNSGTDGEYGADLYLTHKNKIINDQEVKTNGLIVQNGKTVFKWAVGNIPTKIRELLDKAEMTLDDLDYVIPHSANLRILEAIAKDLNLPMDKIPESVTDHGNTSTASIPIAIEKAINDGRIKTGDKLLIIGFGGGLTFAGAILEWSL